MNQIALLMKGKKSQTYSKTGALLQRIPRIFFRYFHDIKFEFRYFQNLDSGLQHTLSFYYRSSMLLMLLRN
jgi:hypothetical protein